MRREHLGDRYKLIDSFTPNGWCSIDTGIDLTSDTNSIESEIEMNFNNYDGGGYFGQSRDNSLTTDKNPIQYYAQSGKFVYNHAARISYASFANQFIVLKMYTTSSYRRVTCKSITNTSYGSATPINKGSRIYILGSSPDLKYYNSIPFTYKNWKIKKNDILVRNLYPCLDTYTGEYGMFDIVANVFCKNVGDGTLIIN